MERDEWYSPEVQGSEFSAFPVALNLEGRSVLVIGGDDEAVQKVPRLIGAGARVSVVAPRVAEALAREARAGRLAWFAREFLPSDVAGAHVVLLTLPDPVRARELRALADRARFWLCAVDQPGYSDFFLVSTVTRGPVQIAVSTGGRAPLLARRLRQALDLGLDARFAEFARSFADLRARLRALPRLERGPLLEQALAGFAMEVSVRYPDQNGQAGPPPDRAREQ